MAKKSSHIKSKQKNNRHSDFPEEEATSSSIGDKKETQEKQVLAEKSSGFSKSDIAVTDTKSKSDFPDEEATSSSIGDKKETQEKQVLAEKNSGFSKSDIAVTDTKSKRVRPRTLEEDQIHSIIFSSTDNTTSALTTANTTTISTTTTSTTTRTIQLGLPRNFKR